MVALAIKEKVGKRIVGLIDHAANRYGIIIPVPKVRYSLRGGAAGAANFNQWVVELNPTLLTHYEDEFITHTVGHEVAHFVAVSKHGTVIFPHGKEWQRVMKEFELPPKITHCYIGPERRSKPRE